MTAKRSSTVTVGAMSAATHGGCTPGAGQSERGDAGWITACTRELTGEWCAIYLVDEAYQWRTQPVHALVLQLHPSGRSRVVPAQLRDGVMTLLDDPRPAACVPTDRLAYWMAKAREKA